MAAQLLNFLSQYCTEQLGLRTLMSRLQCYSGSIAGAVQKTPEPVG
jgi:hypothetical protein